MTTIVPAIIPQSFEELEEKVSLMVGHVDMVAVDLSDGLFSPVTTWPLHGTGDAYAFNNLLEGDQTLPRADRVAYELDMLVRQPSQYVDDWVRVGVTSFVVHIGSDSTEALLEVLSYLKQSGKQIGIAIKPSEDMAMIAPFIPLIDFVQIMGNDKIGYNGVSLDENIYRKIHTVKEAYQGVTISVDIGVNRETAPRLVEAGATKLVSGSGVFGKENPIEEINFYQSL